MSPRPEWFTETDYGLQQAEYARNWHPETLRWLLESRACQQWIQNPQQTLFCHGAPGAGKTVAAAVLVQDLEARFRQHNTRRQGAVAILHAYFDSLRQEEQRCETLVSCLVKQLHRQSPLPRWQSEHDPSKLSSRPDEEQASDCFSSFVTTTVEKNRTAIFIVLDAIDQCGEPCRTTLLRTLSEIQRRLGNVNLLLTSRSKHIPHLSEYFRKAMTLEIRANEQDLGTFLDSAMSAIPEGFGTEDYNHVKSKLVQAANGRFLLARLYVDCLLSNTASSITLGTILTLIPAEIDNDRDGYDIIFTRVMQQIDLQSPERARLAGRTLPWLTFATRPLSLLELQHALGEPVDVASVVSSCGGLVGVDTINGTPYLRLRHRSSQDYLRRHLQGAEGEVGRKCIESLLNTSDSGPCQNDEQLTERLREKPLYAYAAQNWALHARDIASVELVQELFRSQERWESVLQVAEAAVELQDKVPHEGYSQRFPRKLTALHYAARTGTTSVVASLLTKGTSGADSINVNARDKVGQTPLSYAAQLGVHDVVQLLLADPRVDVDARNYDGRTPMSLAAGNGHSAVVSQLLARGANPNWQDLERGWPLWHAAKYGCADVVGLLLESGRSSDLNMKPGGPFEEDNPLSIALKRRYRAVVDLLVRANGIDPSPLALAVRTGYDDAALLMLDRFGITSLGEPGQVLLVLAAGIGSVKLVETLLVNHDIDPNVTCPSTGQERPEDELCRSREYRPCFDAEEFDFRGLTPLMAAVEGGSEAVVRLLLDTEGIQPGLQHPKDGHTALSIAAKRGFPGIVKMLLADKRVGADHKDFEGRTPLSLAAESACDATVEELLLEEDRVDPDCRDNKGRTPLAWAIRRKYKIDWGGRKNYDGTVRRLLATGRVNPNSLDKEGKTPLFYAAGEGTLSVVRDILEYAETDPDTGDTGTPLAGAAARGHAAVVEALLDTRLVDVNASRKYKAYETSQVFERTALSLAAQSGNEDVVTALLSRSNIEPDRRDGWGATPLAVAALYGKTAIVKALLAAGADPNSRDTSGRTPMSAAAERGQAAAAKALLDTGRVDPDVADLEGRTPLSLAAEYSRLEVVKLLIAVDRVDPDSRDIVGRSPLSYSISPRPMQFRITLSLGAIQQRSQVAQILLRSPALDPNAEDAEGLTPLLRAIQGGDGSQLVELLLGRDDIDVSRRGRDGRTPMAVAKEKGEKLIISHLRAKGALDEAPKYEHTARADSDTPESDCDGPTGFQRVSFQRRSSAESRITNSTADYRIPGQRDGLFLREEGTDTRLPLQPQDGYLDADLLGSGDAVLCKRCEAIDLDDAFSTQITKETKGPQDGRFIADLGKLDSPGQEIECSLCQMFTAVRSSNDVNSHYRLLAYSGTGTWLCRGRQQGWQFFPYSWIDMVVLGVVADSEKDYVVGDKVVESGFIGRLGSNCPYGTQSVTIPRLAKDGLDFNAARRWVSCCRKHHSHRCNPHQLAPVPHFHLIECATRRIHTVVPGGPVPPYLALSYVWGPPPPLSSPKEGEERDQDSSILRELPRAVEPVVDDAIRATVALGYSYLWVDRYCIAQENPELKQEQLQSMHLVYANAEITLIAAAGRDSSAGLPGVTNERPRTCLPSTRVKGHLLTCIPPDPASQIRTSTWATRGWTYQEGLLSRRRLYFTKHELSYECRDLLCREAIHHPLDLEKDSCQIRTRFMGSSWVYERRGVGSQSEHGTEFFDQLSEYTSRKLTYEADVLNAMLGILQVIAGRKRKPYYHLCGVPILRTSAMDIQREPKEISEESPGSATAADRALASFVSGLCWLLKQPADRRPGFPSWSWTGWRGVMKGNTGVNSGSTDAVSLDFGCGFEVDLSVVLEDGITTLPWRDCYERLDMDTEPLFSQHYVLEITAHVAMVTFREHHHDWDKKYTWRVILCVGNGVLEGRFLPTRKDWCSSDIDAETTSPSRRLLDKSWLGVVLGNTRVPAPHSGYTYMLIVEEQPLDGGHAVWERVGLAGFHQTTLNSSVLEQRTLRLR